MAPERALRQYIYSTKRKQALVKCDNSLINAEVVLAKCISLQNRNISEKNVCFSVQQKYGKNLKVSKNLRYVLINYLQHLSE